MSASNTSHNLIPTSKFSLANQDTIHTIFHTRIPQDALPRVPINPTVIRPSCCRNTTKYRQGEAFLQIFVKNFMYYHSANARWLERVEMVRHIKVVQGQSRAYDTMEWLWIATYHHQDIMHFVWATPTSASLRHQREIDSLRMTSFSVFSSSS